MKPSNSAKTIMLLVFLGAPVLASDNCYLFDRGSEHWLACKEWAAESDRINAEHNANMRALQDYNAAAMNAAVLGDTAAAMNAANHRRQDVYRPAAVPYDSAAAKADALFLLLDSKPASK